MRKAALCLVVVLAVWKGTSWKATPQWRTVMEQHVQGADQFRDTTLFIPQRLTAYRVTATCNAIGGELGKSGWAFNFAWQDPSGSNAGMGVSCIARMFQPSQQAVFVFTPQVGFRVTLSGNSSGDMSSTYDGIFIIEALE